MCVASLVYVHMYIWVYVLGLLELFECLINTTIHTPPLEDLGYRTPVDPHVATNLTHTELWMDFLDGMHLPPEAFETSCWLANHMRG
eukprot:NODE_3355_length_566_cov_42.549323_g2830_i0.p1 GENE.NODE_3355_length_566_cov_42.549323_g2830_i0~~NODE_3355_length_566_cov_42.549323_g2830_i0.p1  ORF type:complete len:87 (-),score=10.88 NODE_3355_length_566_cov_42.549323_g2830_i0:239-499(-)